MAEKLDGVRLMTLAEMLDVVEDKAGFERMLQTLDVPAFAISNPTCVGAIGARGRSPSTSTASCGSTPTGRSRSRCPAPTC